MNKVLIAGIQDSTCLLLQLQHLPVLLGLPLSEFLRVLPHLPHELRTLVLHALGEQKK